MKIDIQIEKTPHRGVNRLATKHAMAIEESLLELYMEKGSPRDFRKIIELFEARPVRFTVNDGIRKFIFEESDMAISWGVHKKHVVPLVAIGFRGKPRVVGDLSFFGECEIAYQGAVFPF